MIKKHTDLLLGATIILAIGFIITLFGAMTAVYASGACKDGSNDTKCVSQNCSAISGFVTPKQCDKLVSDCENTQVIGSGANQTVLTHETSQGNCSNALRSCFEVEVDTSACGNHQVIAAATGCNDGDMNANGDCGMDAAIDQFNASDGGADYTSNKGARDKFLKDQVAAACDGSATVAEKRTCEESVAIRAKSCYDANGGTAVKADGTKISQCLIDGSTTPAQCKAAGGTWGTINGSTGSDAGGCTRAVSKLKCGDGSEPDAITGKCKDGTKPSVDGKGGTSGVDPDNNNTGTKCGEATTVLINCDGEGVTALGNVLKIAIVVLTTIIGIAAVGGVAWASILYAKAEDNQGNVSEAKTIIRNIVIGILLYGFMIAIINWLVPGGVIAT